MRTPTRLAILALSLCFPVFTACGRTDVSTGPSSTAPPATTGAPAASTPGASVLSLTPSTIQGQGQPQATVTLASVAPDGGALVVMTSSNTAVARVPATVFVEAGSRTARFLIDTSTVMVSTSVTITASYAGTVMAAALSVRSPSLTASFVVRSTTRGLGACVLNDGNVELDCVLDGSASTGFISAWIWTYSTGGSTLSYTSKDTGIKPDIYTKCAFLSTATGGDGPNGDRFLNMQITLQVQDAAGVRSDTARQAVRLYPNHQCGFSY